MCDLHNALEDLECWKEGKGLLMHAEHCTKNYFCSGGHLETGILNLNVIRYRNFRFNIANIYKNDFMIAFILL